MIRSEKFLISRAPYAVDLTSLRPRGTYAKQLNLDAVWYRRKRGVLSAHLGPLWGSHSPIEAGPEAFLASWDGRYGGDCIGRWDGRGYWGSEIPEVQAKHLAVLRPMLEAFPKVAEGWVPEGYDGWWSDRG